MAEHLVTHEDSLDPRPGLLDDAGGVAAEHQRVGVLHHLGHHPGGDAVVDAVQGGRHDPDQHLALARLGDRQVRQLRPLAHRRHVQRAHDILRHGILLMFPLAAPPGCPSGG